MKTLILGANSDIAKALAIELKGTNLCLASRDIEGLNTFNQTHNLNAKVVSFDALEFDQHETFFNKNSNFDRVISAFGYLGNHEKAKLSFDDSKQIIQTNFTSNISILDKYAQLFEEKKHGQIIGISSVAADRGRQSNYYYGASKAGFEAYLSGLRNRLHQANVHVLTVKPGFVKTKMITGMDTPSFLTATPKEVAKRILNASKKKRNIIYVSRKWYWVMAIIKSIPEFIFKKLSL